MEWAVSTRSGKNVPIDFEPPPALGPAAGRPHSYIVYADDDGEEPHRYLARPWGAHDGPLPGERVGVSHFTTCPRADDFSGTGRGRPPRRG